MSNMTDSSNPDAPLAKVETGISEIVSIAVTFSAVLVMFFGTDWGVAKHAQDLAPLILTVVPSVLGLSRAFKHHSAATSNAQVYAAQVAAASASAPVSTAAPAFSFSPPTFNTSPTGTTFPGSSANSNPTVVNYSAPAADPVPVQDAAPVATDATGPAPGGI